MRGNRKKRPTAAAVSRREVRENVVGDESGVGQLTRLAEHQEPPGTPFVCGQLTSEELRVWLSEQQLDVATQLIVDRLDQRIEYGDGELRAVRLLLQHYWMIVSRLSPLAHLGCAPLRPDDRLHECFSQFVDLLHRQQAQIRELEGMVAELV